MRLRDIRLLTMDNMTYTSAKRFVSVNPSKGQQWLLKIHYVKMEDAGGYMCQVSTTPPISLTIYLVVRGKIFISIFIFQYFFINPSPI